MVLSEIFAYYIGKRISRKETSQLLENLQLEEEDEMASTQDWSSNGQDTRSFQELLEQAKEHRANKDNQ
jgi:heme-degrading monooxygenase HmoA